MKLLAPKEALVTGNKNEQELVIRLGYLNTTLERVQARINAEQTNFEQRMREQRELYGEEKRVLQEEILALSRSVDELKKERKAQLVPVRELEAEARRKEEEATKLFAEAESKHHEAEELSILYTEKLDELSTREEDINQWIARLNLREEGTKREADMVSASHARLNEVSSAFYADIGRQVAELSARESAQKEKERLVNATLEDYRRIYGEKERALNDRSLALDRAFDELRSREVALHEKLMIH